ncbi:MAG: acyloxyacyl hydrolase, partial [Flavobacteriales bacterium]
QFSISPYIDLPLQEQPKKVNQWLKLGFGIGYATKVWDLEDNVKALVIGSPFNAAIGLQYAAEIKASKSVFIRSGIRISHFSNASFKLPNLGTNNFTLFVAASIERSERLRRIENKRKEDDILLAPSKKWTQIISYNIGFRENFPPDGPKHAVHTLRYRISKTAKGKSSWGAFAEGTYNRSLEALLHDGKPIPTGDLFQSGVGGVYGLHFGRTQFDFMTGIYAVNQYSQRGPVFNRFGIQHQFTEHLRAQMMLKTHYSKADHFALGVAYEL